MFQYLSRETSDRSEILHTYVDLTPTYCVKVSVNFINALLKNASSFISKTSNGTWTAHNMRRSAKLAFPFMETRSARLMIVGIPLGELFVGAELLFRR